MDTTRVDGDAASYDDDYFRWTQQQAAHLRAGRLDRPDLDNLAEEIESLGKSQLHALTSSYRLVVLHLLKLIVQPGKAGTSWTATIARKRNTIELLLEDNLELKPRRAEWFAKAYPLVRREAAAETGLPLDAFPVEPPFDVDDAEDRKFWPPASTSGRSTWSIGLPR